MTRPADHGDAPEPSDETIQALVDASPNITPELLRRLQWAKLQCHTALIDGRLNEPGEAWVRTIARTLLDEPCISTERLEQMLADFHREWRETHRG